MKLLILSDAHGKVDLVKKMLELNEVDVVVFAGDIAPYGAIHRAYDALAKFAQYLRPRTVIAVPGNMDPLEIYERAERELGIKVVHGKAFTVDEVTFIGVGGSPPTPFGTLTEFTEEEIEELLMRAYSQAGSKGRIVLVTHGPPYNTRCDIVLTGQHVGSTKVREFIEKYQPILCVCGHIHESRAIDEIGRTKIVNPGPLFRGYYAVAEVTEITATVELKKL